MDSPARIIPKVTPLARKHRWGDGVHVGEHLDRTERACALCGLVKVTVHPPVGFPWREWRMRDGKTWQGDATPPCVDQQEERTQ